MRPRLRQRRSFGGKGGVWWRNKEAVKEVVPKKVGRTISRNTFPKKRVEETTAVPRQNPCNGTHMIEPIGWDEELGRPIYPTILPLLCSPVSTIVPDDVKHHDSDRKLQPNRSSKATSSSHEGVPVVLSFRRNGNKENIPPLKVDSPLCSKRKKKGKAPVLKRTRNRTFGNKRKPPPLSLLLGNTAVPSSPTNQISEGKKHKSNMYSPASETFDAERTEVCRLHSPHHHHPRRVSTSPLSEQEESSSTDVCSEDSPIEAVSTSSPCTVAEFSSPTTITDVFSFDRNDESPKTTTSIVYDVIEMEPSSIESNNVERPTATSSLDKVNNYFAHLDKNVSLTIVDQDEEASSSSRAEGKEIYGSSRVIRTSRKVSYKNETLQDEYSDYVRGTEGTGVSPLSITKYAKSRRDHFRRTELFDGFLEEE